MSPDELRWQGDRLDAALVTRGRPPVIRDGDTVVGDIPSGGGQILRLIFTPARQAGHGALFLQFFRVQGDGALVSTSPALRLDSSTLPGVAHGLARALELTTANVQNARGRQQQGGDRRPRPDREYPAPPTSAIPAHANGAPNNHDDRRDDQHDDDHHEPTAA